MLQILKRHKLLLLILVGGLVLRLFWFRELFLYSHDQDLLGWFIKDVVENRHLRLIGQETSSQGVFIGPLFYYLMIPFYALFNWDPIGGVFFSVKIGVFSVWSVYFVLNKIFNRRVGLIGSTIYAFSYLIVMTDREVVPTTPVMLWSVWFLFALYLIIKGKQKSGFLLTGLLGGLIWHLNLALGLLALLVPLAFWFSKKKINLKAWSVGLGVFFILSVPLMAFEVRHDFQQSKALVTSLTTKKQVAMVETTGLGKLDRVMQLVTKNTNRLTVGEHSFISPNLVFVTILVTLILLVKSKRISFQWGLLFSLWLSLFIFFFTFNPINVSEYYLNGMNIVWITICAVGLSVLFEKKGTQKIGIMLVVIFVAINLYRFFSQPINESGYIQRKAVVEYIKQDSINHRYPCVSVSYITKPGFDLGYRYLFYQEKMHVNQPSSGGPVYTIVFPHSMVDRIDKSFGALGLIYPDYDRYDQSAVSNSCAGPNGNLVDPLFGYTE